MGGNGNVTGESGTRLDSWKAIADYLGRDVRSVQRWEKQRGLPVRRIPGEKGSAVFAYTAELDQWLHSGETARPGSPAGDDSVVGPDSGTPVSQDAPPVPSPTPPRSGRAIVAALIAASILMVGTVALLARRQFAHSAQAASGRVILAVLPFANLSGDPAQDYFADGLTEEMITDLGRISPQSLGVIARTSAMKYKETREDVKQIGQELGAEYVLEGSVRREGARARVSAQLIRVSDQTHLWAQNYDVQVKDILSVQRDVAAAIAGKTRLNLSHDVFLPESPRPANEEAYDAFLKGLYFLGRRDYQGITQGVAAFELAVQKDPTYAPAHAGLAEALTFAGVPDASLRVENYRKALAAATRAIELDDASAEAHTALAGIRIFYERDWPGARSEFERALQLNPNYAHAHHWYANLYLDPQGRFDDAIREMKLAQELDPTNLIINADLGQSYFFARRYDEALAIYRKVAAMDPDFLPVHWYLADCYHQMGNREQEVLEVATWVEQDHKNKGNTDFQSDLIRAAYRDGGYAAFQNELRRQFERAEKVHGVTVPNLAVLYSDLGESDLAFKILDEAFANIAPQLLYLRVYPPYDPLRPDPRFLELERRIGLGP
jgi:TolB-like protein/Tfp pilus assembly protein PilF